MPAMQTLCQWITRHSCLPRKTLCWERPKRRMSVSTSVFVFDHEEELYQETHIDIVHSHSFSSEEHQQSMTKRWKWRKLRATNNINGRIWAYITISSSGWWWWFCWQVIMSRRNTEDMGQKEQVGENFNYNSTVTLRQFNGASFVRTAEKACGCLG